MQNKPAYVAIGIDADGEKHVSGIWVARTAPGDSLPGRERCHSRSSAPHKPSWFFRSEAAGEERVR